MKSPIPEAALKKHIAILGMNGSGKTSVAKSEIMEPALAAGERVCNIDPTGVGWGLRLSKSGKSKGYPIKIVGGRHADFPLFRRDGHAWAEIVATSSDSFIFDTKVMTVTDRSLWFTDFAETLLRLNRAPLKLIIDEMHLFAPKAGAQGGGVAPNMLAAANNLLSLGRSSGLRITMISQRPAKLHNDSLTQAHTLIAMALMAPHDRRAVKDWIDDQADAGKGAEIIKSLPSLKPGEGWIWAPREKVLERVRFARPHTFDSSAAPDDGDVQDIVLSPIDPEAIKTKLAAVAKETVANNPATLKATIVARDKRITELEKAAAATPVIDPKAIEAAERMGFDRGVKETMAGANNAAYELIVAAVSDIEKDIDPLADTVRDAVHKFRTATGERLKTLVRTKPVAVVVFTPTPQVARSVPRPVTSATPKPPSHVKSIAPNGAGMDTIAVTEAVAKGERAVLIAIAQHDGGVTREHLTVITGYKTTTRNEYISRLNRRGFVTVGADRIVATTEGIAALGADYEPLPTGDALRALLLRRLPDGERKVLTEIIGVYPEMMARDAIGEATGYKTTTRNEYISRLSRRELVIVTTDGVKAVDHLFG